MFLKITKVKRKNKTYRSAKIVETYRNKENQNRHKVLRNLGPIKSENDLIKFQKILESYKKEELLVDFNKIELNTSKSYGIYYTVSQLFNKYGLDKILKSNLQKGKHQFDVYSIIQALIVNRLENPLSKNKAFEYIQKDYPQKIDCKKEDLYHAMDFLEKQKENIEFEIFKNLKTKLKLNLKNAHYDITSSYFEGHKCNIATYGYNRDGLKGKEQIVIGLVLVDNIPIYHEVFKGNTSDKTTVLDIVETLKNKFKIKKPTIVGDRGMFTKNIIETIEKDKEKYILGFSKVGNKITEEILQKKIQFPIKNENCNAILGKEEIVKYSENNVQKKRYILCIDKNTQKEQLETLEKIKEYISFKLEELYSKFKKSQKSKKGKKMSWESFIKQVDKIIKRNKRLFDIEYEHKTLNFEFKLNENWYKREQKVAGKFVIITNDDLTPLEVLKTYKQLNDVENSFNCIKNQLDLRPINHYKNERVKAHVFICVLALLVEKIMAKSLKEISPQTALEELKRLNICKIKSKNFEKEILSKLTKKQEMILKNFKLNLLLN